MTKLIGLAMPFIGTVQSGTSVMVGALFPSLMVTVNVRTTMLLRLSPSSTVTVMVAVPLASVTGFKVSVPEVLGLK